MNRTAQCIRMLQILKSRNIVKSSELAELLQTNPRNVREFRRELETAGYHILEQRGRHGGYSLDDNSLLSMPALNGDQLEILDSIRDALPSLPLPYETSQAQAVLDQIISVTKRNTAGIGASYIADATLQLSEKQRKMIEQAKKAVQENRTLTLSYQKQDGSDPEKRNVDPYSVVCMKGTWYLIGWDHLRQDYRSYRFSDQRMLELEESKKVFERDQKFYLEKYIGSQSVFKGTLIRYQVWIEEKQERLFLEAYWGSELEKVEKKDGWVCYTFLHDSWNQVCGNLFHFGNSIYLSAPQEKVCEYSRRLASVLSLYQNVEP